MKKTLLSLVVIVAVAVGAKVYLFRPKPVPVKVCTVRRGQVEATVASTSAGTIHAIRETKVAPELSAIVTKIRHREGAKVAFGEPILEMDRKDLFAQYAVACANLGVAESQAAQARLKSDWMAKERDRLEDLHERSKGQSTQVVSEQSLDKARMDAAIALEDVRTAEAAANQRRAERHVTLVNLSKSWMRAPFDGVITRLSVEEGDAVAVGRWVVEMMDLTKVRVHAPLDEVDLGQVRVGDTVRVSMDAYPGRVFPGTVEEISPIVTTTLEKNRTADIKVDVENPEGLLLVGMSADIVVVTSRKENALFVPTKCLRDRDTALRVEAGVARAVKVQIGLTNWDTSEVLGGLAEGDTVISLLDVEEKGQLDGREVEPTQVDAERK